MVNQWQNSDHIKIILELEDLKPIVHKEINVKKDGELHQIIEYYEPGSNITEVQFVEDFEAP